MGGTTRIGEEYVVKEKTVYLPIDPGSGAILKHTRKGRSDAHENRHEKRYPQRNKRDRKSGGGKSEAKKYSNPLDFDISDSDDDHDDKPERKKCLSLRRKIKSRRRVS